MVTMGSLADNNWQCSLTFILFTILTQIEIQSGPNRSFNYYIAIQECMYWASAHISKCLLCFLLSKWLMNCYAIKRRKMIVSRGTWSD